MEIAYTNQCSKAKRPNRNMGKENEYNQSSLFMDSRFSSFPTQYNLFVTPESIYTALLRHSRTFREQKTIWVTWHAYSQPRSNKRTLCLLVSGLIFKQCPSGGLVSATFSAFLCVLLVISLFKMAPSVVLTFSVMLLSSRRLWCALWKKHACSINFI